MKTTTFTIGGMHCSSCSIRNENALKKISGVKDASVNFATHSATVTYDESLVTESNLYDAVIKNGYKVLTGELMKNHGHETMEEMSSAKNKAVLALLLAAPVLVLAMFNIALPWSLGRINISILIQATLSSFVILVLGWEFHKGMLMQAKRGNANMDTLVSIGILAALVYSLWAMLTNNHLYFETGAIIAALILLGRYFEARSRGQASEAIEKLLQLGAKTAHLLVKGKH